MLVACPSILVGEWLVWLAKSMLLCERMPHDKNEHAGVHAHEGDDRWAERVGMCIPGKEKIPSNTYVRTRQ
jgi:hypothetical protein